MANPQAHSDYDVIVVGAGFAGMYAIYKLRQLGVSFRVFEAGTDVGGTWYWNRYPGARCDVPSLEYSFGFSEELEQEWDWPEVFSAQPDILRYANHIAERFDLRRDIHFQTRINGVTYDDDANLWRVRTEQGADHSARFVIMATGCLSVPNKPDLPGAARFTGLELHTGLWPKEDVDLSGKRVGIIGTGSSGVQAIPELARQSGHLYVLQRTPVYTVPANRKAMREPIQQNFKDNYRLIREMQQHNQGGVSSYRPYQPTDIDPSAPLGNPKNIKDFSPAERATQLAERGLGDLLTYRDVYTDVEANEIANTLFREEIQRVINDPDTADSLAPQDYGLGCKRQVLDRDYYETFNRDDVTLVDLHKNPLQEITANGVQTRDAHLDLDVLIYATGFDAMTGALFKANITGRAGQSLKEKWQHGPLNYLGLQMHGFPNLFTVTGPGSPSVLCNMLVAIEQHVDWIGDAIGYLDAHNLQGMEPAAASEHTWVAHVNAVAEGTMYTTPSCNSWYLGANIPGKPRIFMPYVGGYPQYRRRCEEIVANGYEGFDLF
ncbi:MAG: NAD(P)/FAD-dependent oxidoreductase [Pseudomonadota bacterium]